MNDSYFFHRQHQDQVMIFIPFEKEQQSEYIFGPLTTEVFQYISRAESTI